MIGYEVNILPFTLLNDEVEITFSSIEVEGWQRIYKRNLPQNIPAKFFEELDQYAWWSIGKTETCITQKVNLSKNKWFAKYYFNKILYDYFQERDFIVNRNFISDTEVYIEDQTYINNDIRKFKRFSLRFTHNSLVPDNCLLVTYEGVTSILKRNIGQVKIEENNIKRILYKGKITKYDDLSIVEKKEVESIFPILNRNIRKELNLPFDRYYSKNKYKMYFDLIQSFYENHLQDIQIGNSIQILRSGFYKPHNSYIHHTSEDSNLLLFGNDNNNFIPYNGIKENGPIQGPDPKKKIKFIFIFHENDKDYANKLFSYLGKGYKSFPGLKSFVNIDFIVDREKTIRFVNTNPIPEISNALKKFKFEDDETYAGIYISQIKKGSDDEAEDLIYFRLKEILLNYRITSQVIYKENITNPSFNYFLPNIAIALLAKLGGIPWRLYRPIQNDLVIGIGAKRGTQNQNSYVGSAFCFINDGSFYGFNVFEKKDTRALSESIKSAIQAYVSENSECDRLVIHYYKIMSRKEREPIQRMLKQLNLRIPYIVVTINETKSRDYVLFDTSFDGKMPQSGTFIKIRWNEFLLCNNTRYSQKTITKIDGFPFPIKIRIESFNYAKVDDIKVVRELIDQVYQFSRMYWKSVRQRNMPVTIEYSKLIADIVSNFNKKELVPFAKNTLWFL